MEKCCYSIDQVLTAVFSKKNLNEQELIFIVEEWQPVLTTVPTLEE